MILMRVGGTSGGVVMKPSHSFFTTKEEEGAVLVFLRNEEGMLSLTTGTVTKLPGIFTAYLHGRQGNFPSSRHMAINHFPTT